MRVDSQTGITLIELVAAIVVLSLLAAVAGPTLVNSVSAYNRSSEDLRTIGNLRIASERMVREIRVIGRDAFGNYAITTMTNTTFVFTKLDGETVTIDQSGGLLRLSYNSIAATPTLSDELNGLTFSYFQADGITPATSNADVAFIEFELILTQAGATSNHAQRSRIALRN